MRKTLNEEVIKDMMGDASLMSELEREWEMLQEDRSSIRQVGWTILTLQTLLFFSLFLNKGTCYYCY